MRKSGMYIALMICMVLGQFGLFRANASDLQPALNVAFFDNQQSQSNLPQADTTDEWIVKFKDDTSGFTQSLTLLKHDAERIAGKKQNLYVVKGKTVAEALGDDPNVEYIEKNYILQCLAEPNDYYYQHPNNYQWGLKMVNAPQAWDITKGSSSVKVAVIDSGMDYDHEDAPLNVMQGWNYLTGSPDTYDSQWHGTAVAGIIGAKTNNATGIAGINWDVSIIPLHCMEEDGSGLLSNVLHAIYDAVETYEADIINMSFGGPDYSQAFANAVNWAYSRGAIVIASAGNSGNKGNSVIYPAAYSGAISVGSVNSNKERASFSTYNSYVDVAAPGEGVFSIVNPDSPDNSGNAAYAGMNGTSFSAPYISGIAALALTINPELTPDTFMELLQNNCEDLGAPGKDDYYGYGLVDFQRVLSSISTPEPTPVPEYITSNDENIAVDQETKKISYPHYKNGTVNYHYLSVIKSKLIAASGYTYKVMEPDGVTEASETIIEPTYKIIVLYEGSPVATYTFIGKIQYGDVNGDGAITASDLGLMKRYLMNKTANPFVKPYGILAADMNKTLIGANTVTTSDLGLLKRHLMSRTAYPISLPTEFAYDPAA